MHSGIMHYQYNVQKQHTLAWKAMPSLPHLALDCSQMLVVWVPFHERTISCDVVEAEGSEGEGGSHSAADRTGTT